MRARETESLEPGRGNENVERKLGDKAETFSFWRGFGMMFCDLQLAQITYHPSTKFRQGSIMGQMQGRHWFLFDLQDGWVLRACPATVLCSEGQ